MPFFGEFMMVTLTLFGYSVLAQANYGATASESVGSPATCATSIITIPSTYTTTYTTVSTATPWVPATLTNAVLTSTTETVYSTVTSSSISTYTAQTEICVTTSYPVTSIFYQTVTETSTQAIETSSVVDFTTVIASENTITSTYYTPYVTEAPSSSYDTCIVEALVTTNFVSTTTICTPTGYYRMVRGRRFG